MTDHVQEIGGKSNAYWIRAKKVDLDGIVDGQGIGYNAATDSFGPVTFPGATGGEANTAANVGAGADIFRDKIAANLNFRGLLPASSRISAVVNGDNIDLDVVEAQVDHDALLNYSAAQHIDWSAAAAGTIDPSNVPDGADGSAIHDNTAGEIAAVTEKAVPVGADFLLIEDSADSNNKKRVQLGNLPTAGGGEANLGANVGSGADVFRNKTGVTLNFRGLNPASTRISAVVNGDNVDLDVVEAQLLHDNLGGVDPNEHIDWTAVSAGTIDGSNVPDGADGSAIHDDLQGEISAITEKVVPSSGDWLLIEDSGASNAKRKLQIGNLPAGAGEANTATNVGTGAGVFRNKVGVNLNFRSIAAASSKISAVINGDDVDVDVVENQINHDNLLGFVSLEHLDWTADQGVNDINAANISQASVTQHQAAIDHDALTNFDANEHINWTAAAAGTIDPSNIPDGADGSAIHDDTAGEINGIVEKGSPVAGDWLLIEDSADSNNKKKVQVGNLPSAGGGESNLGANVGTGADVFRDKTGVTLNFRGINAASSKISAAVNADNIDLDVVEANVNHNALLNYVAAEHIDWTAVSAGTIDGSNIPNGADGSAVHVDEASEISAVTEKATPIAADLLLIEDSADSNNKKRVQIGNLPGAGETNLAANVGTGADIFRDKTGVTFNFRGINAASTKISATVNADNVDLDVNEANINHDNLLGFVALEHLDWTTDQGVNNIADENIVASSVTQHEAAIDHDALTNFDANEHIDWTAAAAGTIDGSNVPDGADGSALHDDTSGEIAAIAEKTTPVAADLLVIEDSAASNAKKRVQVSNLPGPAKLIAEATALFASTSLTDVLVTGMTLTPPAGTYAAIFTSSMGTTGTFNCFASIYLAGAIVLSSERQANLSPANATDPFCCTAIVTVNGSQAVEGRFRVAGGTGGMFQRSLLLIKVAP